jgi:glucose-1-phosphate adenylyltransferase
MDVRQMVDFHRRRNAAVSVAAIPVPLKQASTFGIIDADEDGRIRNFVEKPERPQAMPGDPTRAYGSMGNYIFDTEVLLQALQEARRRDEHDFARHILPRLVDSHGVYAYDFAQNRVPGIHPYEEPAYWRDVGNIDAYFAANQDVLGAQPRFDLLNAQWLVCSSNYQGPTLHVCKGQIENSTIGAGSIVKGGRVRNSVLRREVVIEEDAELEDCIVMDNTVIGRGAKLHRVIVDRYNSIEPGTHIGYDVAADRGRYHVSESGLVVVARQAPAAGATHYQER